MLAKYNRCDVMYRMFRMLSIFLVLNAFGPPFYGMFGLRFPLGFLAADFLCIL